MRLPWLRTAALQSKRTAERLAMQLERLVVGGDARVFDQHRPCLSRLSGKRIRPYHGFRTEFPTADDGTSKLPTVARSTTVPASGKPPFIDQTHNQDKVAPRGYM